MAEAAEQQRGRSRQPAGGAPQMAGMVSLSDLDPRSRDRLFQEVKKVVLQEMGDRLMEEAKAKTTAEHESEIIMRDIARRKTRVMEFMKDLMPKLDRYPVYAVKELSDREPIDEVVHKWPGTSVNRRNRITVMGLIASIGYQFTSRPDGSGGEHLRGMLNDRQQITGFAFVSAQPERKREYETDPTAGIPRVST
jgi:hypothetical protein